jgi:hypothetical protein
VPCTALERTSEPSSAGERADRNSSAGSTPSRRTIQLADPFSMEISQRKIDEKNTCGPTTARAVRSGLEMARFFGTSSPNTMDSEVASSSAMVSASGATTPCGRPVASNGGSIRFAIAGSAMYPVIKVVMVMPSWAPDSWKESVRWARWMIAEVRSPTSAACRST